MLTLRPDQRALLDAARAAIRHGTRKFILQGSTGFGKTVIAASILAGIAARGKRGWFVNHRREILRCSQCGAAFVAVAQPREVAQVEGELAEVDVSALRRARGFEEAQCRTLDALQALARKRGYAPGWAHHRWQARQGRRRAS